LGVTWNCPRFGGTAVIEIVPAEALADEPVAVRLGSLQPGQRVVLKAKLRLGSEPPWRSQAEFLADDSGTIDLTRHAPQSGSYEGIEPMGLFWSMLPEPGAASVVDLYSTLGPISIDLTAEIEGRAVAHQSLRRLVMGPDLVRTPVREDNLVATLFHPASGGPHAGIIVLGGSEGGLAETQAALLASHGYATLALAYFGIAHLPRHLCLIPLEYFRRAIHWMISHPAVAGDRVTTIGGSRGGELVLLLGATFPEVAAVVGVAPGGVVTFGLGGNPFCYFRSSWSLAGRPVAFVPMRFTARVLREIASLIVLRRPIEIRVFYDAALQKAKAVTAATIPVERIRGPVLLLSGEDDRMWRSSRLSEMAIERLEAHHHPYPYSHVSYPGCGHFLGVPSFPAVTSAEHPGIRRTVLLGGTRQRNARASVDGWSRLLAFLGEHLPSRSQLSV
jgi:dienelactone hydrolase